MEKQRFESFVLTDHAKQMPHLGRSQSIFNHCTRQKDGKGNKTRLQYTQRELIAIKAKETKVDNVTPEFTVYKIVRHVGTGDDIWYVVSMSVRSKR